MGRYGKSTYISCIINYEEIAEMPYSQWEGEREVMTKKVWMVRAGRGGVHAEEFESQGRVAIGWAFVGDLTTIADKKEIEQLIVREKPEYKKGKVNITVSQLSRFRFDMREGEYVITYNGETRDYLIGEIISGYEYIPGPELCHTRRVKWEKKISRDALSTSTKNFLLAWNALFLLSEEVASEMLGIVTQTRTEEDIESDEGKVNEMEDEQEEEELDILRYEVIDKAREFIKDAVLKLEWDDMQDLVAGILRGMGFKTTVSQKGPDMGRDVVASHDGLGLTEPRIIVEVKHRGGQIGSHEIRSFVGGLKPGDKGMYVSTGGFTKEGKYEAKGSNIPVALVDLGTLVGLLVDHYDNLDPDTKALIPLVHVYWPKP